jgi:hypothetical protein
MRHEHQLFVGLVPLLLAAVGALAMRRARPAGFVALTGALIIVGLLTLSVAGGSLWLLIAQLPVAGAFRAMSRIELVLLFPLACLVAAGVESLRRRHALPALLAIVALIGEAVAVSPAVSEKGAWQARRAAQAASVPAPLPAGAVLFFAQTGEDEPASEELDAMWAALVLGVPTLNGYSGSRPIGFELGFGRDCGELVRRLRSYADVRELVRGRIDAEDLARRVVPVGFSGCSWQRP